MKQRELDRVEHSVIAFYWLAKRQGVVEKFYNKALTWFEAFGCEPHLMSNGKGKLREFRSVQKTLKARGFSGIEHLEIDSLPEGIKTRLQATNLAVV